MATLSDLLLYEVAIEDAIVSILTDAGLTCYTEFTDTLKSTPFAEVQLQNVRATEKRHPFVPGVGEPVINIVEAWDADFLIRLVTQRGKNSDDQRTMTTEARLCGLEMLSLFTPALSPYHVLDFFSETGMTRSADSQSRIDVTELRYKIRFRIAAGAWDLLT